MTRQPKLRDSPSHCPPNLTAPDGSQAFVPPIPTPEDQWLVTENGPTSLWEPVERAYDLEVRHNHPDWHRLGPTVTTDEQAVWIDHPDSSARWTL